MKIKTNERGEIIIQTPKMTLTFSDGELVAISTPGNNYNVSVSSKTGALIVNGWGI